MIISKTRENGKLILMLEGRLDTTTSQQLQDTLLPSFEDSKEIMLDFAGLAYISSAGLRVLLMGQKEAKKKGGSMTIRNISDEIMDILDMTGFSGILTIV